MEDQFDKNSLRTKSMEVIFQKSVLRTYLLNMNRGFQKHLIYCLIGNIVESMKVSLIERLFANVMCVSNPRNTNFNYLPFDCDQG